MNLTLKNTSVWLDSVPDKKTYPTLSGNVLADVVVIGGGLAGVLSAWRLASQGLSVALLEKNHIATGDTGLTTGFLTRVPDVPIADTEKRYGPDFLRRIFDATREAEKDIFSVIQEHNIACDFSPCDAYYGSYKKNDAHLKREWEIVQKAEPLASLIAETDTVGLPFAAAIRFPNDGQWNVRKFIFGLLATDAGKRIQIYEETEALELMVADRVAVKTSGGMVRAGKVIVATGNLGELMPELGELITQYITYVIAARFEKTPLPPHIYWDTLDPYFYYRRIDEQTMIIGGADIAADRTHEQKPFEKLAEFVKNHFGDAFTVMNEWSGSILHTKDGIPYVFRHPHYGGKVFAATGFGGNGMVGSVLASLVLKDLCMGEMNAAEELLSPKRTDTEIPAPVKKAPKKSGVKAFVPAAKTADFGKKAMLCKELNGTKIAIVKIRDSYYAIDNTCTHAGGSLCDGTLLDAVVQCPLHGAKFDVTNGGVVGPPATRMVASYAVRVSGDTIEVEVEIAEDAAVKALTKRETHWKSFFAWLPIAATFWLAQFAAQYFWLTKGEVGGSLVRSFALSGATCIGLALLMSSVFKFFPTLADYWRLRRYLGVTGFTFIVGHMLSVYHFLFAYNVKSVYYTFNPLKNPIIFGSIAFPIFMMMALTSTDWAVEKLGSRRWKHIHQLVYIAYLSAIFHFLTINPVLLKNPPGYLLLAITALALGGQLYWFIRTAAAKRFRSWGTVYGLILIAAAITLGFFTYRAYVAPTLPPAPSIDLNLFL